MNTFVNYSQDPKFTKMSITISSNSPIDLFEMIFKKFEDGTTAGSCHVQTHIFINNPYIKEEFIETLKNLHEYLSNTYPEDIKLLKQFKDYYNEIIEHISSSNFGVQ